jgi:hypothetical protein
MLDIGAGLSSVVIVSLTVMLPDDWVGLDESPVPTRP